MEVTDESASYDAEGGEGDEVISLRRRFRELDLKFNPAYPYSKLELARALSPNTIL